MGNEGSEKLKKLKGLFSYNFELDSSIPNGIRWKDQLSKSGRRPAGTFDPSRGYYRTSIDKVKYRNTEIIKILSMSFDESIPEDLKTLQDSYREASDLIIRLKIALNRVEDDNQRLRNELADERKKWPSKFQLDF